MTTDACPAATEAAPPGERPRLLLLNGPNLNLLGSREPAIYGRETLADAEAMARAHAEAGGFALEARQSNHEGQLVDWVQEARGRAAGIVINPGAYGHTSIALLDALQAYEGPVIEVHVSNIHRREAFRHHSHLSARADAVIVGCGVQGYVFAVERLLRLLRGTVLGAPT